MHPRITGFSVRHVCTHKGITILLSAFLAMLFSVQLVLGTEIYKRIFGDSTNTLTHTFFLDNGKKENTDDLIKALARLQSKIDCLILSSSVLLSYTSNSEEEISEDVSLTAFYPDVAQKYKQQSQEDGRSADLSSGRLFVLSENIKLLTMAKELRSEMYPVKVNDQAESLFPFDGLTLLPDAISYGGIYTSYEKLFELTDNVDIIVVECTEPLTRNDYAYLESMLQTHVMGEKAPDAVLTMDILSETGLLFAVLALCAFNFSALFDYLFSQRENEFQVYRICGGKTRHILLSLITEYLIIITLALLLSLPIIFILHALGVFRITEFMITPRFAIMQLLFFFAIMFCGFLFRLAMLIPLSKRGNGGQKR